MNTHVFENSAKVIVDSIRRQLRYKDSRVLSVSLQTRRFCWSRCVRFLPLRVVVSLGRCVRAPLRPAVSRSCRRLRCWLINDHSVTRRNGRLSACSLLRRILVCLLSFLLGVSHDSMRMILHTLSLLASSAARAFAIWSMAVLISSTVPYKCSKPSHASHTASGQSKFFLCTFWKTSRASSCRLALLK